MSGERPTASRHRDVQAFADRALTYETGFRGRLHREIVGRTAEMLLALTHRPRRVLDVGCGTGLLLGLLAERLPDADTLAGVDAAEAMIAVATRAQHDPRLRFTVGVAQALPYPDASFDLVLSTTSFDHWPDQPAGLAECNRVLAVGGNLVLTELFSRWLTPTLVGSRRAKARTRKRAQAALYGAGLRTEAWHKVMPPLINMVVANKSGAGPAPPSV